MQALRLMKSKMNKELFNEDEEMDIFFVPDDEDEEEFEYEDLFGFFDELESA